MGIYHSNPDPCYLSRLASNRIFNPTGSNHNRPGSKMVFNHSHSSGRALDRRFSGLTLTPGIYFVIIWMHLNFWSRPFMRFIVYYLFKARVNRTKNEGLLCRHALIPFGGPH
jgi:hypothetical protein